MDFIVVVLVLEWVFKDQIFDVVYVEVGIGLEDLSLVEVYDLFIVLEFDWYEYLGFCFKGEVEVLLCSGVIIFGGRVLVNLLGGLVCFGEVIFVQVIVQVCELIWQLCGQVIGWQVVDVKVGVIVNQGLFGYGLLVIVVCQVL